MEHRTRKWIQKSGIRRHRGALHRALGISGKIPMSTLHAKEHARGHLGHMVREAITLRHISERRKHRRRAHHLWSR
jgi:hypothetical protein